MLRREFGVSPLNPLCDVGSDGANGADPAESDVDADIIRPF